MLISDGTETGLTDAEAAEREALLRQLAEADGVAVELDRVPEPSGLVSLTWRVVPLPQSPAQAASPAGVAENIRNAAQRLGVDERLLAAIAQRESGLNPDPPHNPHSTARGLFQFIDDTWNNMVARYGASLGVTAAQRTDVRAQCLIAAKSVSLYVAALQNKLGRRPTPGECYAAHFLGPGAAGALIAGDQAQPVDAAIRAVYPAKSATAQGVLDANPSIFTTGGAFRTVGQVLGLLDDRIRQGLAATAHLFDVLHGNVDATPASADPPWLAVARAELARGVAELPGSANNPRIEEYFTWTSLGSQPDNVAWCAAFASFCLGMANKLRKGTGSARAADWMQFGHEIAEPVPGCIVVLTPNANRSGHVAFWIETVGTHLRLLGGNQGDRVSIDPFPLAEKRSFRMPN